MDGATARVRAACNGLRWGIDEAAAPTAEPVASAAVAPPTAVPPTAVAPPTAVPEPTNVVPELTNDDRTAAALAAFEANPQPAGVIAWDVLETVHRGVNTVDIITCGWTGESAFDDRTVTTYRVPHDDDGALLVVFESSAGTLGECVNTELIESALQATRDYDLYWGSVLEDPTTFKPAIASEILAPEAVEDVVTIIDDWVASDISWRGVTFDGELPVSATEDVLWRRFEFEEGSVLEVVSCRPVPQDFGIYRDSTLVDDFKPDPDVGGDAIHRYRIRPSGGVWLVLGVESLVWANCGGFTGGWIDGVNNWKPDPPVSWQRLPS